MARFKGVVGETRRYPCTGWEVSTGRQSEQSSDDHKQLHVFSFRVARSFGPSAHPLHSGSLAGDVEDDLAPCWDDEREAFRLDQAWDHACSGSRVTEGISLVMNFTGDCDPGVERCGETARQLSFAVRGLGALCVIYLVVRFVRSHRS